MGTGQDLSRLVLIRYNNELIAYAYIIYALNYEILDLE